MNIAFLTPEYPHPKTGRSGGLGTSIMSLAKGLVSLGHNAVVVVYQQDEDASFEEEGIVFHKIKNVKFKGLSWWLTRKKIEQKVNALYDQNKIDIIEAPDWTGITAFMKLKCPITIKLHGSDSYFCHLENRPVKWKNHFLEKKALTRADRIVSVSEYAGRITKEIFQLNKGYTVIPNAINTEKFKPVDIEEKPNTILYFGTLIRKKGLLELAVIFNEVIKKNKEATLLLIGNDSADIKTGSPSTWHLMQQVLTKQAREQTHYIGVVSYSEIKYQIAAATVCVFPTFAEALPVSWLEAMAMQKAIVASNIGWATEIIDNSKNGFLVHPEDHQEFANRIIQLLHDSDQRCKFGENARMKVVNDFSPIEIVKRSIEQYEEVIKSHNRN